MAAPAAPGHTCVMAIPTPISRLTLIPAPRTAAPGSAVVRRYRLARVRLNGRPAQEVPHGHLKRVYD